MISSNPEILSVKPNRRGYIHRALVTVIDDIGMDEKGNVITDLPLHARDAEPTIYVVLDPARLLSLMEERWGDHPGWNFKLIRTGDREEDGRMERVRLDRFGLRIKGRKRKAMHMVWSPGDMAPNPGANFLLDGSHSALMDWAKDFRQFHCENNLPLSTTFSGVAAKLLRDSRFYPEPRRRVPKATNERAREFLPGVHQEFRGNTFEVYSGVALDQSRAYHRIVQEIPLPNSDSLFARGFFTDPFNAPDYWCRPGDELYERTIKQPGLVFAGVLNHTRGKNLPYRIPATDFYGHHKIALWTNEIELAESAGIKIEGLYAALTSTTVDTGLSRYGAWALAQINNASPERARWLKPTLHATYGILGARPRKLRFGYRRSSKGELTEYLLGSRMFPVHHVETRGKLQPPTANVPQLGVIQAEVRKRTIQLANQLLKYGVEVPHIHADGLHAIGQLPIHLSPPDGWTIEPVTNLRYIDPVSWISDEGEHLPGRGKESIDRWRIRVGMHRTR